MRNPGLGLRSLHIATGTWQIHKDKGTTDGSLHPRPIPAELLGLTSHHNPARRGILPGAVHLQQIRNVKLTTFDPIEDASRPPSTLAQAGPHERATWAGAVVLLHPG